ncbi:MAG TPA: AI-2E family transporter [Myxococcaceae bacterium]|nr:AI-2E family transporter [Myxococcaceae bacterium]
MSIKTAATVCAVVLAAAALVWLVFHTLVALTLTVTAALIAVALNHGVERLERRRVPRGVAIALLMLGLVVALAGLIWLVVPAAIDQLKQLSERAPDLVDKVKNSAAWQWASEHASLQERLDQLKQDGMAQKAVTPAFALVGGVAKGVAALVTILFLAIFMLAYGGRVVRGALAEALPHHRERYERVLRNIDSSVGGYLSGLCFIGALNATLTSIFLAILRVPLFLPLGILSGIGSFLPLAGVTISGAMIGLVALATKGPWVAMAGIAYHIFYQQFENHVVTPLVYKRTVELNPLVTLLGIIFLAELGGIVGAFLAVPIVSAAQIVVRELLLVRRERLGLPREGDVSRAEGWTFWRRHRHA